MRKTIWNWMPKGAILLGCFASAFAATDSQQQPKTAGVGLPDPIGIASPQGGQLKGILVIQMAEPPYPTVLTVDLVAVIGVMVAFRRRISGVFS